MCAEANVRGECIENEKAFIAQNGYSIIRGPWLDKFNHRCYYVLTPCGHEWEIPFNNFTKLVKNVQAKGLPPACGTCGPRHRMKKALVGFIAKYGIDYDLTQALDYEKKVRRSSEATYKKFKHDINPLNLKRGLAGEPGAHHVDHIVSIRDCFRLGWTVEQASAKENLQMLTWEDNLSKGTSHSKLL
jgi:5-methylcytosine-specific restriction endonuclease McrA